MLVSIINWQYLESSWDYLALSSCVAVACSDTLASEIGSLDTRTRSIINLQAVPQGTNGGMSPTGTVARVFGALSIAVLARILPVDGGFDTTLPIFICLVSAIGWFGCQIDSLLRGCFGESRAYRKACCKLTSYILRSGPSGNRKLSVPVGTISRWV